VTPRWTWPGSVPDGALAALTERLLRLGPDLLAEAAPGLFAEADHAVALWRDVWAALRLQERYVPLEGLDAYQLSPSLTGEILRPLLGHGGDIRIAPFSGRPGSNVKTLTAQVRD
jgi:hypothetical protein